MSKRISKHELKEDKFVNSVFQGYHWSKDHTNTVIGVVVVILVVILGFVGYNKYNGNHDKKAADALGIAMQTQRLGNLQDAEAKYKEVIENYPSMEVAQKAKFLLGSVYFEAGMFAQAREQYEAYLQLPIENDMDMLAGAHIGVAACYEDEKEFEKAIEKYQFAYDTYPNYFDRDRVYFAIGRCHMFLNNIQEANDVFTKFLEEYKDSPLKDKAQTAIWRIRSAAM